jgi:hypothetical protein
MVVQGRLLSKPENISLQWTFAGISSNTYTIIMPASGVVSQIRVT